MLDILLEGGDNTYNITKLNKIKLDIKKIEERGVRERRRSEYYK